MKDTSVLLVSSSGGHWVQMSKILEAFEGLDVDVATVYPSAVDGLEIRRLYLIKDFNRDTPLRAVTGLYSVLIAVWNSPATHIVSTGALPGLVALMFGRLLGRRTLWLDSIANARKMSMSGRLAIHVAHETLSQWEEVAARHSRVRYEGRVV